jgi:hypothetical protein
MNFLSVPPLLPGTAQFSNISVNSSSVINDIISTTTFNDGTITEPSIAFTSSTGTGMWTSASDTIDFSTGGSRVLQLASAGPDNYLTMQSSAHNEPVLIEADGSDTNISIQCNTKGTGTLQNSAGYPYATTPSSPPANTVPVFSSGSSSNLNSLSTSQLTVDTYGNMSTPGFGTSQGIISIVGSAGLYDTVVFCRGIIVRTNTGGTDTIPAASDMASALGLAPISGANYLRYVTIINKTGSDITLASSSGVTFLTSYTSNVVQTNYAITLAINITYLGSYHAYIVAVSNSAIA